MNKMLSFIKTTIIGGILFLIPIVIVIIILTKAFQIMMKIAQPLGRLIPVEKIGGVALANIIAVLGILLLCFLAGLLANRKNLKRMQTNLEDNVLINIPGYRFIKGITDGIKSNEKASEHFLPVLAEFDDNAQVGFEIERTDKNRVVVYLPGSPNPWSGTVVYVAPERIIKLDMTPKDVIKMLQQLGSGSHKYDSLDPTAENTSHS
ncbi:DUF502 domain-containing protein [Robertkochia flava]|uniref:DUF502 domain-containing protein n=1 Tax=Robertkochia flava TaxID=3447986 RepID=UPI001CCA5C09|nr:DUF502 domain-containing protein [Robertkochia marina]